jgi:hypothetical protein
MAQEKNEQEASQKSAEGDQGTKKAQIIIII